MWSPPPAGTRQATSLNALAGEYPPCLHVLPLDVAEAKSRASLVHDLPLVLGDADASTCWSTTPGVHRRRFGHVEQATLEDSLRTNAVGLFLLAGRWRRWPMAAASPASARNKVRS